MKVAVCDDIKEVLKEIELLLKDIPFVKKIDVFSDIELLYAEIREGGKYDVILMDIDWKEEQTGIEYASKLFELNPCTKIIYMTAYTVDYIEDAVLKTKNLSGFLVKPVKKDVLEKILVKIKRQAEEVEGKLVVKYKSNVTVISFSDIYYLESNLHKVNIKLNDQEYQCTERLTVLKNRLGNQFIECHKSYLVNMEHISEFRSSELVLENGEIIPVSKKRYGETKARFFEYMANRL